MPRYIDADALKDNIAVLFERNEKLIDEWLANCVDDVIDEQPSADVVERKTGKWVYSSFGGYHCSECGKQAPFWCFASTQQLSDFCPNCGADMRKETDDA